MDWRGKVSRTVLEGRANLGLSREVEQFCHILVTGSIKGWSWNGHCIRRDAFFVSSSAWDLRFAQTESKVLLQHAKTRQDSFIKLLIWLMALRDMDCMRSPSSLYCHWRLHIIAASPGSPKPKPQPKPKPKPTYSMIASLSTLPMQDIGLSFLRLTPVC